MSAYREIGWDAFGLVIGSYLGHPGKRRLSRTALRTRIAVDSRTPEMRAVIASKPELLTSMLVLISTTSPKRRCISLRCRSALASSVGCVDSIMTLQRKGAALVHKITPFSTSISPGRAEFEMLTECYDDRWQ